MVFTRRRVFFSDIRGFIHSFLSVWVVDIVIMYSWLHSPRISQSRVYGVYSLFSSNISRSSCTFGYILPGFPRVVFIVFHRVATTSRSVLVLAHRVVYVRE